MKLPLIVIVGVVVLMAGITTTILMFEVIHGPVTGMRLDRSVAGAAGRMTMYECTTLTGEGRWDCGVWIDEGRFSSGGVGYTVQVKPGSSCWTGWIKPALAREAHVPVHVDGCVRRWQLPL